MYKTKRYGPTARINENGFELLSGPDLPRGWKGESAVFGTSQQNEELLSAPIHVHTEINEDDDTVQLVLTTLVAQKLATIAPKDKCLYDRNSPGILVGHVAVLNVAADENRLWKTNISQECEIEGEYYAPQGMVARKTLLPITDSQTGDVFYCFQLGYVLRDDLSIAELRILDAGTLQGRVGETFRAFDMDIERHDRCIRVGIGQLTKNEPLRYVLLHEAEGIGIEEEHSIGRDLPKEGSLADFAAALGINLN